MVCVIAWIMRGSVAGAISAGYMKPAPVGLKLWSTSEAKLETDDLREIGDPISDLDGPAFGRSVADPRTDWALLLILGVRERMEAGWLFVL